MNKKNSDGLVEKLGCAVATVVGIGSIASFAYVLQIGDEYSFTDNYQGF